MSECQEIKLGDISQRDGLDVRKPSKIPRARPKISPSATPRSHGEKSLIAPLDGKISSKELNNPLKCAKDSKSLLLAKTVRDVELKLITNKRKLKTLSQEIMRKRNSSINLHQDILDSCNLLKELTGLEHPVENEFTDSQFKIAQSVEKTISELSDKLLSIALNTAQSRKDLIQWIGVRKIINVSQFESETEQIQRDIDNIKSVATEKLAEIKTKLIALLHDSSEQIKAFEELLAEKNMQIGGLRGHLKCLEEGNAPDKKLNVGKAPKKADHLATKYMSLYNGVSQEKLKLEKELEEKDDEFKKIRDEFEELKKNSLLEYPYQDGLLDQEEELKEREQLIKVLVAENQRLREKIGVDEGNHDEDGPVLKHKKVQAELDPKHRSSRRQIQILKSQVRRMEQTIKRMPIGSYAVPSEQGDVSENKDCNEIGREVFEKLAGIFFDENDDIRRLEDLAIKMRKQREVSLQSRASLAESGPDIMFSLLPIRSKTPGFS